MANDSLLKLPVYLHKQLVSTSAPSENIVYSPFNICTALSMALAGARGNTARQLQYALHVNSEGVHSHSPGFHSMHPHFAPYVKLHVANRMYSEQTYPILDSYADHLQGWYDATIESVDFRANFEQIRLQVNAWVEQATESKIKDLLPSGCVDSSTTLILVNAIYFRGRWNSDFNPNLTRRFDFHLDKTNKTEVDMMYQNSHFRMGRSDDLSVSALEIPYHGGKASMFILLPDDIEGLSQLEERLTPPELFKLLKSLSPNSCVDLCVPKFKLDQTINLKQALSAIGIRDLLTAAADFKGICAERNLSASGVFHRASVEVDEGGTGAAGASAIEISRRCAAVRQTVFLVDHPFMFLICSDDPEAVLFMGSVRRI